MKRVLSINNITTIVEVIFISLIVAITREVFEMYQDSDVRYFIGFFGGLGSGAVVMFMDVVIGRISLTIDVKENDKNDKGNM